MYGRVDSFSPWFPEIDPEDSRALTWSKRLSQRGTALLIQMAIATTVLIFNVSLTTYALRKYNVLDSFGDIYQGDCNLVKRYNVLIHLGINVASTLLLSSSNYCAQLLVAPTRSEVDAAHEKGDWLDIGIPSLRNLRRISPKRKAAWILLIISSILLHLVWNSAVFAATPYSRYRVAIVTSDYLADTGPWPTQNNQTLRMLQNPQSLSYLSKTQCIERYISFTPGQKDVLVVTANITMQDHASLNNNASTSLLSEFNNYELKTNWIYAQSWLCSAFERPGNQPDEWCTAQFLLAREEQWSIQQVSWFKNSTVDFVRLLKVDHCLSAGAESLDRYCTLRYSAGVLVIVCILNAGKCAAIYYTAYLHYRGNQNLRTRASLRSLVTVGDAIASFLTQRDLTTEHLFFADMEEFTGKRWSTKRKPRTGKSWPTKREPRLHKGSPLYSTRWFRAASCTQWLVTITLSITLLTVLVGFLANGIHDQRHYGIATDIRSLIAQGLSTPQPYATGLTAAIRSMGQLAGFYVATLYANMFQVRRTF